MAQSACSSCTVQHVCRASGLQPAHELYLPIAACKMNIRKYVKTHQCTLITLAFLKGHHAGRLSVLMPLQPCVLLLPRYHCTDVSHALTSHVMQTINAATWTIAENTCYMTTPLNTRLQHSFASFDWMAAQLLLANPQVLLATSISQCSNITQNDFQLECRAVCQWYCIQPLSQ